MVPPEVPEIARKESSPPCEAEVRAVVSFDEMMSRIGEFGLFQFLSFLVFSFGIIMEVMFVMAFVFEAATPDHWCATPQLDHLNISADDRLRLTIPADPKAGNGYSTCAMYDIDYTNWTQTDINDWLTLGTPLNASQVPCRDGWSYDRSIYSETIVTQWDLVCDESWKASFAYSAIGIGQLVGAMFWGSVIDRFGRKKPYFLAMTSMVMFAIAVSFSPNYIVYCILQSLMGINTVATYAAGVTLAVEMTGIRFRGHLATAINYAWTFGYMVLALIAYGLRGWRMLQLVISASSSVLLLSVFFVPESVRWLYSKKRNNEAEAILRRVSRVNRKLYPEDVDVQVIDEELSSGSFLDLFRTPKIRRNSLILLLNWFSNGFIYYGISLFLPSMGGNAYLNFFISGAIEIPGYIVAQTSIAYIGRKWPLCFTMTTGGIALLCTMGVPESLNWLSITLAMIGKLCITASWAIVICFTAELYPTVIRGVGFFICTLCGNIGNILAPLVGLLTVYSWYLPLVIFGGFSIVSGLASILLPETKGRPLPDTIEDAESRIGLTGDSESMASKEDRSQQKDQSSGKDRSLGKDQSPKNSSSFGKSLKVSPGDVSELGEVNQMEDIQEHF